MGSKTLSTLIGVVVVIAGIYITWKLIKAVGIALIVVGIILIAARVLRR
jgi:hypothetical protein